MVTHKTAKIETMIAQFQGRRFEAHYYGYFDCFNRQLFYEAHDVLEDLWLPRRKDSQGNFYKGLIQLAGAFVHLQKNRLKPADALFNLAKSNLAAYRPSFSGLNLDTVLELVRLWQERLKESNFTSNPLQSFPAPSMTIDET